MSKETHHESSPAEHQYIVRVLIDMDDVLADTDAHVLTSWRARYPDLPYIKLEDRVGQFPGQQYRQLYGPEMHRKVFNMCNEPGFFAEIPPKQGAISAVKALAEMEGVEVFICTAGIPSSNYHATDKLDWVSNHLGQHWVSHVILAPDKTLVCGDLLIDDKPDITGSIKDPTWKHVFFKTHWNRHADISKEPLIIEHLDSWEQSDKLKFLIDECRTAKYFTE